MKCRKYPGFPEPMVTVRWSADDICSYWFFNVRGAWRWAHRALRMGAERATLRYAHTDRRHYEMAEFTLDKGGA